MLECRRRSFSWRRARPAQPTKGRRLDQSPTSPSADGSGLRAGTSTRIGDLLSGLESRASARGWSWQDGPPLPCVERALDTEDRRLERAGVALILHEGTTTAEFRMLPLPGRRAGLTQISPIECAPESRIALGVDDLPGELGERVRAVIGSRALVCRRTHRFTRFPFRAGEGRNVIEAGAILEFADLESSGPSGGAPVVAQIDLGSADLAGWFAGVGVIGSDHGEPFAAEPLSELDYGQALLGHGPVAITAEMSAAEAAFAILRRQCVKIVANEPVARLGEDPEGVHDMRVAIRRARAVLKSYEFFIPGAFRLERGLRWVASQLGPVRDLDVQLAAISSWSDSLRKKDRRALAPIEDRLRRRKQIEHKRMLRALDSTRWSSLVRRLGRLLRQGPSDRRSGTRTTVLAVAPAWIADGFRELVAQAENSGDSPTSARLHKLRIRCKALRYTLEFHASLFAHSSRAIRTLTALQDLLGEHQDAVVAESRLRELASGSRPQLPRESIFVCGCLAESCRRRARRIRRRAPEAIGRFIEREHRRFAKLILEAAPTPGPNRSTSRR